jgi:peptide/nickel transport system permease protein
MNRYRFVLHRPLQLLWVVCGISVVTFVLVRLIPGDPARTMLGTRATPTAIADIRAEYGLDEPLWVQYLYFLQHLARGELGRSILYKADVLPLVGGRLEPTLALVLFSVCLAVLIAIPPAALGARQQSGVADHAVRVASVIGMAFPPFCLALVLIFVFGVWLGVLPISGYGETLEAKLAHLVLPGLTVALPLATLITRSLRASLVELLASDVATAARARGMPESVVFWRHAMPNSLGATVNLLAVNAGWLLGGTVIVESVFALPGIGQLLVRAVFARDYFVVQGVALVFACWTVLVNVLADVLTVAADPRVTI